MSRREECVQGEGERFRPAHATVERITPYVGGKPLEELAREKGLERVIKLASNENPLGPPPSAVEAVREEAGRIHLYPDGACRLLRQELAERLEVSPGSLVFGNGSNELLELIAQLTIREGLVSLYAWPAFEVYRLATLAHGGETCEVPLDGSYRHDLEAMARAITPHTRLVFINNPNNPTGTWVGREELERFLDRLPPHVLPVLDEAYFEYAAGLEGFPDGVQLLREGRQLVVLRTFSKAYGLSGLRVGYAVMPEEFALQMERVRQPFNVNRLAQVAAVAALSDRKHLLSTLEANSRGMEQLARGLEAMGHRPLPSAANFMLVQLSGGGGSHVYRRLLERGVIVRPMDAYGLPSHLRVTVGTQEENELFMAALAEAV